MKYNFDEITDRRSTNSLKWEVCENELPMWVADMDFKTAPEVQDAIMKRAAHGVFGYSVVPDEWAESYVEWWKKMHGFTMDKDWLVFCTGVVPAISAAVRKLTTPAEKVLIQTPVYNIFFNSIINNGRYVIESPLVYDGRGYSIAFDRLEEELSDPQTTLMILCNPHNPVGKLWDRETLQRIGELCKKHGVTVISDEIHCDITAPGREYVPFAAASEVCAQISVTCMAPTKTFNMAGLQTAAVMIPNKGLRHKLWRALNTDEVAEPNAFAVDATVAAFRHGAEWVNELRQYIYDNKCTALEYINAEIPGLKVCNSEATYLMWLDFSEITDETSELLAQKIRQETGLYLSAGEEYGACGMHFLRMNVACPRAVMLDGLERLKKYFKGDFYAQK